VGVELSGVEEWTGRQDTTGVVMAGYSSLSDELMNGKMQSQEGRPHVRSLLVRQQKTD
jgi:hypothetical protein